MKRITWQIGFAACVVLVSGCSSDQSASNAPTATGNNTGSAGGTTGTGNNAAGAQATGNGSGNATAATTANTSTAAGAMTGSSVVLEPDGLIIDDGDQNAAPMGPTGIKPGDAVDMLLVVDNSTSMGDKQAIFRDAVPDLIDQMVNPPCFDTDSQSFVPYAADGTCDGLGATVRQVFPPVEDIHIGIITSSLGSHGLGPDQPPEGAICDDAVFGQNDWAHLIPTVRPDAGLVSFQDQGFLVWDSKDVDDATRLANRDALVTNFQAHVDAVGETGCGFEAPLEAAYRFLVEPEPYAQLIRGGCSDTDTSMDCVIPDGVDQDLLNQRAAFLRPDSAVVVVFLTDENDCSVKDRRQGYFTVRPVPLAGGTLICDTDPNDPCCHSCASQPPAGCETDETLNGCVNRGREALEGASDNALSEAFNLRCFNQKQRFGIDLLYSTERYIAGFKSTQVADRNNQPAANPLFAGGRTPDRVFVVGIVGTPWQDTAEDPSAANLKLQRTKDLNWEYFLPLDGNPVLDPFNIETTAVRTGTQPLTGDVLGGPDTQNPINGHDRILLPGDGILDDIQYACIFPLSTPRDCTAEGEDETTCDCTRFADPATMETVDYSIDNPLCQNPQTGEYETTQYYAKAYPAPRMFEVLYGMGEQGVLSSICPKNALDGQQQDFGYRPAIRALLLNLSPVGTVK